MHCETLVEWTCVLCFQRVSLTIGNSKYQHVFFLSAWTVAILHRQGTVLSFYYSSSIFFVVEVETLCTFCQCPDKRICIEVLRCEMTLGLRVASHVGANLPVQIGKSGHRYTSVDIGWYSKRLSHERRDGIMAFGAIVWSFFRRVRSIEPTKNLRAHQMPGEIP
jgi:hypothetical protein